MLHPRSESTPTPLHRGDRVYTLGDVYWVEGAALGQLERDLHDLPELVDQLDRHYAALLRKGSRNPDDPWIRYPVSVAVLDVADRRTKADAVVDPIGEADLARRIGERRQGAIPTLATWVSLAVGEMHDLDIDHDAPMDPDRVVWVVDGYAVATRTKPGVSATSEAGWLSRHLDWICTQQWATELADDVRSLVVDLERMVGPAYAAPDANTVGTTIQLAAWTGVPARTIRQWASDGLLIPAPGAGPKGAAVYYRRDLEALRLSRGLRHAEMTA